MKNIFLLVVLLFSTVVLSQEQPIDSLVTESKISETERIVDKYGGKIVEGFNRVVEGVAPVAEEGFKIAVKLQIAKGIVYTLPIVLFFTFLSLTMKEYNRINNILNSDNIPSNMNKNFGPISDDNVTFVFVTYAILTSLLLFASFGTTFSGVQYLVAPEWFAIKDIIELVKQ